MRSTHHHATFSMSTATITADSSDDVLQAARAAVAARPAHAHPGTAWRGCGAKNLPLLILLDGLVGAAQPVAAAVADNAWDDTAPIPWADAKRLAEDLHRLADTITAAAAAPDHATWSLPSMTGKELV